MAKTAPIIAVDFDDVLVATNLAAAQWHNREYGTKMALEDFLYYHWWKNPYWGPMKETVAKVLRFYTADEYKQAGPVLDAPRICKQLKAMGYRLIIVTARSDEHRKITEDAINKYFPGVFDGLEFTASIGGRGSSQLTKPQMLKQLGASMLIDDSLDNCMDCAKSGIPVLLFGDYEWNKRRSGIGAGVESMGFEEREKVEVQVTMATLSTMKQQLPTLKELTAHYVKHRPKIQRFITASFVLYVVGTSYNSFIRPGSTTGPSKSSRRSKKGGADGKPARVEVDAIFYARLKRLLRIVIPSIRSKEALLLAMHSAFLVFRTVLSLYVADLDGKIVSSLVRAQTIPFLWNILRWLLVAIPATYTNSMLGFIQNKLAIAYRTRLTEAVMDQYLGEDAKDEAKVFYKMSNLDDRIKNPDQMITVDINRFSTSLAAIYGNVAKPILDVILYNYQLSRNVGAEGLVLLTIGVQASAALLRALTPPFGNYAATEAALSGQLRHSHSRLVEASEEVAFYGGEQVEKYIIERDYFALVKHINRVLRMRVWHGIVEEGIIKYVFWVDIRVKTILTSLLLQMAMGQLRVFFKIPGIVANDLGARTESFVTNRRLLLSASDAFGRVMYSYKELSELAGYTSRVAQLFDTMSDVRQGKFDKQLVSSASIEENARVLKGRGSISVSDDIEFINVPIVSPNGDILVRSLSFHVKPGQHLLIVGPNGCGKSSLFRILGGLWPVYGGTVRKPPAEDFTYIPQRPYLSLGTLRDQIIYPHSKAQMERRGMSDQDLYNILAVVGMEDIVEREGGWDVAKEWRDTLSGGDKQRIAMARLFYHEPKYAILDECTSAVPLDIERIMFEHATSLGITLLTVSHRPSLWQYHQLILQYDGQGGYVFTELDAERRLALQEEKQLLEQKLLAVPKMKQRLAELKALREDRAQSPVIAAA
ncbi:hypothetical protein FRB90_000492 [Tulasnella sp. 427]|nr:hypothetical protein FRB90_000492 [Tulasnella sp. 427]